MTEEDRPYTLADARDEAEEDKGKPWEEVWSFMSLRHDRNGPFWSKGDPFDYRSCWAGLTHPSSTTEIVKMCADALIEESAWHEHPTVNEFAGGKGTIEERRAALIKARNTDLANANHGPTHIPTH